MATVTQIESDGIALAEVVRNLARRSYRVLSRARDGQPSDPHEIRALLQQIAHSRRQVLDRRPDELRRWLESLYSQMESLQTPPVDTPHADRPHFSL